MDWKLLRHIEACRNAVLPGDREKLCIGAAQVGWVKPDLAEVLGRHAPVMRRDGERIVIDPGSLAALPGITRTLAQDGWFRWRDEDFDVRDAGGRVLTRIDRGALPALGLVAEGAHCNGLVERSDGLHLWVGLRAADRPLDPGKLDHLAAGGIAAGLDARETLIKEAQEEAGVPADLAAQAIAVGTIGYAMERAEGLRRDRLHCFDLRLPEDFQPAPQDDEIAGFELWPIGRVVERVRETDDFKFNVNLVLIDLFLRLGLVDPELREALDK